MQSLQQYISEVLSRDESYDEWLARLRRENEKELEARLDAAETRLAAARAMEAMHVN